MSCSSPSKTILLLHHPSNSSDSAAIVSCNDPDESPSNSSRIVEIDGEDGTKRTNTIENDSNDGSRNNVIIRRKLDTTSDDNDDIISLPSVQSSSVLPPSLTQSAHDNDMSSNETERHHGRRRQQPEEEENETTVTTTDTDARAGTNDNNQTKAIKELRFPAEQLDELFYVDRIQVSSLSSSSSSSSSSSIECDESSQGRLDIEEGGGGSDDCDDDDNIGGGGGGGRHNDTNDNPGDEETGTATTTTTTTPWEKIMSMATLKKKKILFRCRRRRRENVATTTTTTTTTAVTTMSQRHRRIGVMDMIRFLVNVPVRASPTWRGNLITFLLLVSIPTLINMMLYIVGTIVVRSSVDDGYTANRDFVWMYSIPFEMMQIYPFIELCNQAMSNVDMTIRSRLITLVASTCLVKGFQYVVWVTGIFTNGHSVFPFPLSPVSTAVLGSIPAVPLLYVLSSQSRRHHFKPLGMIGVIATLWFTALLGLVWVVGIVRTKDSRQWQNVVAGLFGLVVYVCRIEVGSKTMKNVSTDRWPQINAIGNIILFNFQFFAYPYIRGPIQLGILLMSQIVAIHWKVWASADRLMTAGRRLKALYQAHRQKQVTSHQIPCALLNISYDLVQESHFEAIQAKQVEHGELVRSMTSETLNLSFSNNDEEEEEGGNATNHPADDFNDTQQGLPDHAANHSTFERNLTVVAGWADDDDYDGDDEVESGRDITTNDANTIFRRSVQSTEPDTSAASPPTLTYSLSSSSSSSSSSSQRTYSSSLDARHPSVQRYIYLLMEATNTVVIYIIIRSQQEIENILLSYLSLTPSSSNRNNNLSDFRVPIPIRSSSTATSVGSSSSSSSMVDDFTKTQLYGWSSIGFMIIVLIYLMWRIQGRKVHIHYRSSQLTMAKVLAYSFSTNFWLYLWWFIAMSLSVNMGTMKHWGMDYSFQFQYFECLDDTKWPGCPSPSPSPQRTIVLQ